MSAGGVEAAALPAPALAVSVTPLISGLSVRAGAIYRCYIKLNGFVGTRKDSHRNVMSHFRYGRAANRAGNRDMDADFVGRIGDRIKFHFVRTIGFVARVGDEQRVMLEINRGQFLGYLPQIE